MNFARIFFGARFFVLCTLNLVLCSSTPKSELQRTKLKVQSSKDKCTGYMLAEPT